MKEHFENPQKGHPQSGYKDHLNPREAAGDIRSGARQEDQLERLHPGDDPERKNTSNNIGSPPDTDVDHGSPEDHQYPRDEQRWPENKVPTK